MQGTTYSLVGSIPLTLDMVANTSEAAAIWGNISFQLNTSEGEGEDSIYFKRDDILGIYFIDGVNEADLTIDARSTMPEAAASALVEDLKFSAAQVECQISVCDKTLLMTEPRIPTILPYCTRM